MHLPFLFYLTISGEYSLGGYQVKLIYFYCYRIDRRSEFHGDPLKDEKAKKERERESTPPRGAHLRKGTPTDWP